MLFKRGFSDFFLLNGGLDILQSMEKYSSQWMKQEM